jgi:beta-1,4-mannosyl-glycoprotein beta-1,4-N-acetylglucosaminyltransferase
LTEYDPDDIFKLEYFQRNAIERGLLGAKKGDKIIVSDCDEIVNPEAVEEYKDREEWIMFSQKLFYYFVDNMYNRAWCRPVMAPYGSFKKPNDLRMYSKRHSFKREGDTIASNGGWHYSYMTGGDAGRIKDKVSLFAEKHLNKAAGTIGEIAAKIVGRKDLYGRTQYDSGFSIINISEDKPKSLDKFLEKYPDFILFKDNL